MKMLSLALSDVRSGMTVSPTLRLCPWRALLLLVAMSSASGLATAQYKIVGPDNSITYTDKPPIDGSSRVIVANPRGVPEAGVPTDPRNNLPTELRGPAGRYPVTLYTSDECAPCTGSRELLNRRGIPYVERTVNTPEDIEAFRLRVGGRTLPVVTIGTQTLIGLVASEWQSYLDAAGYPRDSRLPSTYRQPLAQPLTPPKSASPPPADTLRTLAPPDATPAAPTQPAPRSPSGIRF